MTELIKSLEPIHLEVTQRELRYFISCGLALMQNVPEDALPTYCGLSKGEILAVSLRLREIADQLDIDM
jgi:short-subunit dehydrogenase involved in D-alanine esterification of teichoic acids